MSKSSEEIIARPIVSWFKEYASAYNFEPNGQFLRELDDDKFKNLDLDKLWELVGPCLKDLIKEYLESYQGSAGETIWFCSPDCARADWRRKWLSGSCGAVSRIAAIRKEAQGE